MNRYIIDRINLNYAVCETNFQTTIDICLSKIENGAKVGDVIVFKNGKYIIDKIATLDRKNLITKLQDKLFS